MNVSSIVIGIYDRLRIRSVVCCSVCSWNGRWKYLYRVRLVEFERVKSFGNGEEINYECDERMLIWRPKEWICLSPTVLSEFMCFYQDLFVWAGMKNLKIVRFLVLGCIVPTIIKLSICVVNWPWDKGIESYERNWRICVENRNWEDGEGENHTIDGWEEKMWGW